MHLIYVGWCPPLPQHELVQVLHAEPLIVVSSPRRFASSPAPPFSLPLLAGPASPNALSPHGSVLPDTLCFSFFSLIIFNLIYDYSCSRFIDIRYGSRFFVNSIYDYSCS